MLSMTEVFKFQATCWAHVMPTYYQPFLNEWIKNKAVDSDIEKNFFEFFKQTFSIDV